LINTYIFLENDEILRKNPNKRGSNFENSIAELRGSGSQIQAIRLLKKKIVFYQNPNFEDSRLKSGEKLGRDTQTYSRLKKTETLITNYWQL
jgi:hypothetical protein